MERKAGEDLFIPFTPVWLWQELKGQQVIPIIGKVRKKQDSSSTVVINPGQAAFRGSWMFTIDWSSSAKTKEKTPDENAKAKCTIRDVSLSKTATVASSWTHEMVAEFREQKVALQI